MSIVPWLCSSTTTSMGLVQAHSNEKHRWALATKICTYLVSRSGRYDDNYRLSQYVVMTITVNYHGDIIGNVSNYIFATL